MATINRHKLRILMAISSGRVSAAKSTVSDLEQLINDVSCKLEKARSELKHATYMFTEACKIEEMLDEEIELDLSDKGGM
jgi:hypothetical protein